MIKVIVNDAMRKVKLSSEADLIDLQMKIQATIDAEGKGVWLETLGGERIQSDEGLKKVIEEAEKTGKCAKIRAGLKEIDETEEVKPSGQPSLNPLKEFEDLLLYLQTEGTQKIDEKEHNKLPKKEKEQKSSVKKSDKKTKKTDKKKDKYAEDANQKQDKTSKKSAKHALSKIFKNFAEHFPALSDNELIAAEFIKVCKDDICKVFSKHAESMGLSPVTKTKKAPIKRVKAQIEIVSNNLDEIHKELSNPPVVLKTDSFEVHEEEKVYYPSPSLNSEGKSKLAVIKETETSDQSGSIMKKSSWRPSQQNDRKVSFSSDNEVRFFSPSQDEYSSDDRAGMRRRISDKKKSCLSLTSEGKAGPTVGKNDSTPIKVEQPQKGKDEGRLGIKASGEDDSSDDWAIL